MRITTDPAAEARRWINDGGGGEYPAVFINGFVNGVFGFWRSDDNCITWNNIGTFLHTMCLEVI